MITIFRESEEERKEKQEEKRILSLFEAKFPHLERQKKGSDYVYKRNPRNFLELLKGKNIAFTFLGHTIYLYDEDYLEDLKELLELDEKSFIIEIKNAE